MKNAAKRIFTCKIGADTAENEQHLAEILPKIGNYHPLRPGRPAGGRLRREAAAGPDGLLLPHGRLGARQRRREQPRHARPAQNLGNLANFVNFWRARSRLYQNEILQVNMRLTAFVKLYKMCILLHRSKLQLV